MCFDKKRKSIWINSSDGLIEFNLAERKFHQVDLMSNLLKIKDYDRFVGIDLDTFGRLWFATSPKGILIYDPANQTLKIPFPEDSTLQQDISIANSILYCDREGTIWSGFWLRKGIYQIIPFSPAVKLYTVNKNNSHSLNDTWALNFLNAGHGKIWIETLHGGINILDIKTGEISILNTNDFQDLTGQNISPVILDTLSDRVWVNTNKGIFVVDLRTKKSRQFVFKDSVGKTIKPANYSFPLPFKDGSLFISDNGNGTSVYIIDKSSETIQEILKTPNIPFNILSTRTDNDHFIFLKGASGKNLTYSKQNNKWLRIPHPMDSIPWTCIYFNGKDSSFWVAVERELIHYNMNFEKIHTYNQDNGLPEFEISSMIADNKGNIWFHTDRSIHQLNTETGEISVLTEKDGFQKQDFELIQFNLKDDYGNIYFSGGLFGSGFNQINPDNYTNTSSSIYLQSLEVNQRPFPLTTGINNLKELSLRYAENKITLETGVLDFYSKGSSNIRFKLETESKSAKWQYAPANYTIRYEGLQPGIYSLHMQASNAANEFNGPEKVLLINISPPWWQTWWARTIFILALAFSLWGFIQYRSRNLKQRNVMLEEKVMHRTKELKHSLENLRDTQTQLIQREKMASLGELTAGIAHEIQNPLNFVNNFSEVNVELIEELKDLQIQGSRNLESETELLNNIKDNEQKISHHGKRADAIVKGMLQHSRINSGLKELTNVNELADEYLRLSYHGLRAKEKSFNATLNEELDQSIEQINIIPQDMGRVFLNLFNNAFYSVNEKKKEQGESFDPTVLLVTRQLENKVMITIRDNGLGISQKIIDKIYNPFFTTKPPGEGTGLGLSLSYDIVTKIHDGELIVESVEGEFAQFTIILPK